MKRAGVLVASGAGARFFELNQTELQEVRAFVNPEAHAAGRDLESDKQGRSFDSHGQGRHAMEASQSAKDRSLERFAIFLTESLVREHVEAPFEALVVTAPPHLLGMLRPRLSSKLSGTPLHFLDKALLHCSCSRIGEEVLRVYKPHLVP
jgi:protein required for attachment to host cells